MSDHIEDLRLAVSSGRAVLLVGSGLSAAVTNGAPEATWTGLIESGIEFASRTNAVDSNSPEWVVSARQMIKSTDTSMITTAASLIGKKIDELGLQAKATWLRDSVGSLKVENPDWLDAIAKLPCPILTTNYDQLIETHLSRGSTDRSDLTNMQASIAGTRNDVVHLHGIWNRPETVVLSDEDYARMMEQEGQQSLQRAISSTKSLIYLGFGSGIADANFSRLLAWHRRTFPNSGVQHYRLCRDAEKRDLLSQHINDSIYPVSYGPQYSDLPSFVDSMLTVTPNLRKTEVGIARNITEEARSHLLTEVRADMLVFGNAAPERVSGDIAEFAFPPILSAVPFSPYIQPDGTSSDAPKRLDLDIECARQGVTVLVGDHLAGVTTAMKWLLIRAAEINRTKVPIYLSFKNRSAGSGPFARLLRQQAIELELIGNKYDSIPNAVVAVDDFIPTIPKLSDNLLHEIAKSDIGSVFIGCHTGDEAETVSKLRDLSVEPRVIHLGRLNTADVTALAKLANPASHTLMTERVVSVLRAERLPRNPFTVSLLISILLRGEEVASDSSPTGILDQYISVLLGKGDPSSDARYSIGTEQSLTGLSALAKEFAYVSRTRLSEDEAVGCMTRLIAKYAWPETALDMLYKFRDARILHIDTSGVSYVRSAYLHLFAAKAAQRDQDFKQFLLQDPLRFSAVIRHYAALERRDDEVLAVLHTYLDKFSSEVSGPKVFSVVEPEDAPKHLVDDLNSEQENDEHVESDDRIDDDIDLLENMNDTDRQAFPEVSESEHSYAYRLTLSLETISSVLRDSDEVSDLKLKERLLQDVLSSYGRLLGLLGEDPSFRELQHVIIESMKESDPQFYQENEEFFAELFELIPCALTTSLIEERLASRKLLPTLMKALMDDTFRSDQQNAVPAALLLISIKSEGWVAEAKKLLHGQSRSWIFHNFIIHLLLRHYFEHKVSPKEDRVLLDFVSNSLADRYRYKTDAIRKSAVDRLRGQLESRRMNAPMLAQARKSDPSATPGSLGEE